MLSSAAPEAFDRIAERYAEVCDTEIFAWMRQQVHARLARRALAGSRVLEIGCGAGLDAVFLAERGADVVACNPAPGMLACTARLAAQRGVASRISTAACGVGDLPRWLDDHLEQSAQFDGLFSDFGALNCVESLSSLRELMQRRLKPGGWIILCLISRFCWIEVAGHLAMARPRTAVRRLSLDGRTVVVDVGGVQVPTFYHQPGDVRVALAPECDVVDVRGLAVMVPPPYWAHRWMRFPAPVRRAITRLDGLLAPRPIFRRMGDHFLIELVKR